MNYGIVVNTTYFEVELAFTDEHGRTWSTAPTQGLDLVDCPTAPESHFVFLAKGPFTNNELERYANTTGPKMIAAHMKCCLLVSKNSPSAEQVPDQGMQVPDSRHAVSLVQGMQVPDSIMNAIQFKFKYLSLREYTQWEILIDRLVQDRWADAQRMLDQLVAD